MDAGTVHGYHDTVDLGGKSESISGSLNTGPGAWFGTTVMEQDK